MVGRSCGVPERGRVGWCESQPPLRARTAAAPPPVPQERSVHPADPVAADARAGRRAERWLAHGARVGLLLVLLLAVVLTLTPAAPLQGLFEFHESLGRLVSRITLGQTDVSVEEAEAFANVLLFVPIGFLLRLALPRVWSTLLLAVATAGSLGIEVVQYLLLPGRTPSLVDVLTNGGGTAIGLVVGVDVQRLVRWWARRRRAQHVGVRGGS